MQQGPGRLMALLDQEVLGWWQRPLPVCLVSAPFGTRTVACGESRKVRMGNALKYPFALSSGFASFLSFKDCLLYFGT